MLIKLDSGRHMKHKIDLLQQHIPSLFIQSQTIFLQICWQDDHPLCEVWFLFPHSVECVLGEVFPDSVFQGLRLLATEQDVDFVNVCAAQKFL